MTTSSGSNPILDFLRSLWALFFPPPPEVVPAQMQRKVFALVFLPAAAQQEAAAKGWKSPDDLMAAYIARMSEASGGMLVYQLAGKQEVKTYPLLEGNLSYDDASWARARQDDSQALRRPGSQQYANADYARLLQDYNLLQKVQNHAADEVWLFGGPLFGFYESCMVGRGAFWCNGPALQADSSRFLVMGFNYEREVKEMVHDYGHRAESILAEKFGSQPFLQLFYSASLAPTAPLPAASNFPAPKNDFEQFLLDHGTVHRQPGGVDYSQDEFAWLSAFKPEWWPPTIEPDRV